MANEDDKKWNSQQETPGQPVQAVPSHQPSAEAIPTDMKMRQGQDPASLQANADTLAQAQAQAGNAGPMSGGVPVTSHLGGGGVDGSGFYKQMPNVAMPTPVVPPPAIPANDQPPAAQQAAIPDKRAAMTEQDAANQIGAAKYNSMVANANPAAPAATETHRVFASAFEAGQRGIQSSMEARKLQMETEALEYLRKTMAPQDFALLAAGSKSALGDSKFKDNFDVQKVKSTDELGYETEKAFVLTRDANGSMVSVPLEQMTKNAVPAGTPTAAENAKNLTDQDYSREKSRLQQALAKEQTEEGRSVAAERFRKAYEAKGYDTSKIFD